MFNNDVPFKRPRTVKVLVYFGNTPTSLISVGTGFPISPQKILTCCHIIQGKGLNILKTEDIYRNIRGNNDHEKLAIYFQQKISRIEIEFMDGIRREASLLNFDELHDGATLELRDKGYQLPYFKINQRASLQLAREIFFCGFPESPGYLPVNNPFAVCVGIISTLMPVNLGQSEYEHLRINSISLGGNSGSPVFMKNSNRVVAVVNGSIVHGQNRVPLGVVWATPLKTLRNIL